MNMETDLVPFLNIPKNPVYEITSENEAYQATMEKVNEILDFYCEKPQKLLDDYKQYEWLGVLNIKDYEEKLFNDNPSIKKLRQEL
mmetsp:Transcript_25929/g.4402  ORF Transcript_25929/g.4402 Transcript_25929/m.4402 type:complete len:86 (-) Transcript_25929:3-260(-)|eukprot:CAMPEP_0168313338 /NCGR_PEP_ID=MMETSP0210-20121227/1449_1 /TAXON_ID=40633 /ORGANISM="Condylostoma magnum, Strain COL2" /LENGTH=85 /DNA_ID=CAMNT_0008269011 /DNA_START=1569 /DNA_END=1826 /DNA_ORIENTATION=-